MAAIGSPVAITRIVNACVLIETAAGAVLTDPYFNQQWFMPLRESIGMKAAQLPPLGAILGGHGAPDHWQPKSLMTCLDRQTIPTLVATAGMMKSARAAGFSKAEIVAWHETRSLSANLSIEVVPAHRVAGQNVNNYVICAGGLRVFVGTEARDIEPLRQYGAAKPAVDIAILPIDGSSFLGHRLVMRPKDAVAAARALGAKILVPIHYALKAIPVLLQTPGSLGELISLTAGAMDLRVVPLTTGCTWRHDSAIRHGA
jgi:L-ascorbate metabolism protein UlaG (beta-lactamase superfamily)